MADITLEGRFWGELVLSSAGRWSTASAIRKIGEWKQMMEWESGISKVTSLEGVDIRRASITGKLMVTLCH